jgi:hypothetical protein
MTEDYLKLVIDVILEHPGPWKQQDGYGDNGGKFTSITDRNHNDVFDGECSHLSESVFNLLLNFPELAAEILHDNSTPAPPLNDSRRLR